MVSRYNELSIAVIGQIILVFIHHVMILQYASGSNSHFTLVALLTGAPEFAAAWEAKPIAPSDFVAELRAKAQTGSRNRNSSPEVRRNCPLLALSGDFRSPQPDCRCSTK